MDYTAVAYRLAPRFAQACLLALAMMYLCRAQTYYIYPEKQMVAAVFLLSFVNAFAIPIRAGLIFMFALAVFPPAFFTGIATFVIGLFR
jgi:hypothetical protein